jgi:hypothetical protein
MQCSKSKALFNHLVGAGEQRGWDVEAERLRRDKPADLPVLCLSRLQLTR